MKIKDDWLPTYWRGKNPGVRELKHFGITIAIGFVHIHWRDRCGDLHWAVNYHKDDELVPLEEFHRLSDAIKFAKDPKAVLAAVAFEKGEA